eukprot:4070851-Pleurochrysis_carterae.AAC.1
MDCALELYSLMNAAVIYELTMVDANEQCMAFGLSIVAVLLLKHYVSYHVRKQRPPNPTNKFGILSLSSNFSAGSASRVRDQV